MTKCRVSSHREIAFPSILLIVTLMSFSCSTAQGELLAGVAKVDVTDMSAGPANDRMYVRALVLKQGESTAAIVTVDAVAIGEIGPIKNDYLGNVRMAVEKELGIAPNNIMANASHCHGLVVADVDKRTVEAITTAATNMVPVHVGVGHGHEDRIQENRRLRLKNGREIDVRHAYSMPPDDEVAEVGPIDPEIGILRLDRVDGRTLAVLYNFACHPIQGAPSGGNTADITGFSSAVIEDNLDEGTVALFVQGCGGDINPAFYKEVNMPRSAEPLGNMLGLSTLKAVRKVQCKADDRLTMLNETIELPRADLAERINLMEDEKERLLRSLGGTTLNLKTFLPLIVKYNLAEDFPSYYSHSYLNEETLGRNHLTKLDDDNRRAMEQYIRNIHTMEQLTRLQTNLRLLEKHQAHYVAAGKRTVDVELAGLRIGDFVMVTSPGELVVQIGLNLKKASPHEHTFVAGYTNGYIYYAPTAEQLNNRGGAQEDSDCILAPEWQKLFEDRALEMLKRL
ncbi:MAG: hypothetical protein R3C59_24070 [Planctomycetaceae bacterium]